MTTKLAQMIDRNSISISLYDKPFCGLDRSHKIGVAEELYRLGLTSQSRKLKDELGVAHGGQVAARISAAPAVVAASAEQKQEAVVKPLEWVRLSHGWIAHAAFGSYQIEMWQEQPSCLYWQGTMLSLGDDDEAAKAAAQADYERRIRSALVAPAR